MFSVCKERKMYEETVNDTSKVLILIYEMSRNDDSDVRCEGSMQLQFTFPLISSSDFSVDSVFFWCDCVSTMESELSVCSLIIVCSSCANILVCCVFEVLKPGFAAVSDLTSSISIEDS